MWSQYGGEYVATEEITCTDVVISNWIIRDRAATGHLYFRAVPSHVPSTETLTPDISVAAVGLGEGAYAPIKTPAWFVRRVH